MAIAHILVMVRVRHQYVEQLVSCVVILEENVVRKCAGQVDSDGFH